MLIRGGENVYPLEIENVLYEHPKVKDVQVSGKKKFDLGPNDQVVQVFCIFRYLSID